MIKLNSDTSTSLLQQVQERQQSLAEKLASGKQINSAADGAAAQHVRGGARRGRVPLPEPAGAAQGYRPTRARHRRHQDLR